MTIHWCGNEIEDFEGIYLYHSGTGADPSYSRCSLCEVGTSKMDYNITTGWISYRHFVYTGVTNYRMIGITNSNKNYAGIFGGSVGSNVSIGLLKFDGTTQVNLAQASINTIVYTGTIKVDINIMSYGVNGHIKMYSNGVEVIDYYGDISIPDVNDFDSVWVNGSHYNWSSSEIIIADEDTRLMRLKTLVPNEAGSINNWNGLYTSIDELNADVSDTIYTNIPDSDFRCNMSGMPTGVFDVKAMKLSTQSVDSTNNMGIQLGVYTNNQVYTSETKNCTGYWKKQNMLLRNNPITGLSWTAADIEALQINLRAKTL